MRAGGREEYPIKIIETAGTVVLVAVLPWQNARYKTADGGLTSVGLNWRLLSAHKCNYEDLEVD